MKVTYDFINALVLNTCLFFRDEDGSTILLEDLFDFRSIQDYSPGIATMFGVIFSYFHLQIQSFEFTGLKLGMLR